MIKIAIILVLLIARGNIHLSEGNLRPGFYKEECASAEEIVRGVVEGSVARNPRNAAILLRLQFHDCFVGVSLVSTNMFLFLFLERFNISFWFLTFEGM